jgi:hypothetical protein
VYVVDLSLFVLDKSYIFFQVKFSIVGKLITCDPTDSDIIFELSIVSKSVCVK